MYAFYKHIVISSRSCGPAPFINLERVWRLIVQFMCGMSLDSNVVGQSLDARNVMCKFQKKS